VSRAIAAWRSTVAQPAAMAIARPRLHLTVRIITSTVAQLNPLPFRGSPFCSTFLHLTSVGPKQSSSSLKNSAAVRWLAAYNDVVHHRAQRLPFVWTGHTVLTWPARLSLTANLLTLQACKQEMKKNKKWTFPRHRVHYVQYQYFYFILHFTYAPNAPPCLRTWTKLLQDWISAHWSQ